MRNTVSRSLRTMISKRSPVTPTKWGMSITASGSVQRTSSRSPGVKDFNALRVLSAGRGHFSPDRSNLVMVMARHVRIVRRPSIAASLVWSQEPPFIFRQPARVAWPAEALGPFLNANTIDDLAEAQRLAAIEDLTSLSAKPD
jgi:hypothetical protein